MSGIQGGVAGYNHKLPIYFRSILAKLAKPTLDPARFKVKKDLQLKEYANFFKGQPYSHARYAASHLLEMTRWHILNYVEILNSSDKCSHEGLMRFAPQLLAAIRIVVLVHGNTSRAEAAHLVHEGLRALGSGPLHTSQLPALRLLQLPANVEVILRLHPSIAGEAERGLFNLSETNSAIELTLQAGMDQRPLTVQIELLCQILGHPAYEQLRTKEQLGYIVNLGERLTRILSRVSEMPLKAFGCSRRCCGAL